MLLPRYSEDPGAILASLNLLAAGDDGPPAEPPTSVDPPTTGDGDRPHRTGAASSTPAARSLRHWPRY